MTVLLRPALATARGARRCGTPPRTDYIRLELARDMRQKRTTAIMTAMYKYSGRLTLRWARSRGGQAANGA
jgi:hypothetical protein